MGLKKWWQNNRKLQKVFLIVSVFVVLLVLFVILLWCAHATKICTDPECVRTAAHILNTIDPSVDPCDNFYNFACGGFLKNTFALGQPTMLQYLKELMQSKLKEIVVETTAERNLSKTLVMQRQFYRACTNDVDIEEDNDQTFLRLLDESVGGWPVLKGEKWNDKDFEWDKSMVKARKLGLFYQFYFRVEIYSGDNSNSNVISIKPPHEKEVSTFYWQSQHLHLIHEIALKWGAAHDVKALHELKRTMYFAEQLDQIVKTFYYKTPASKPHTNRTIAIKDLDHKLFKLNWVELLRNITGVYLEENHLVVFDAEDYFTDLYYVLLMKTPKRTQANYMSWALISNNLNYLSKKIRDKYQKMTRRSNDKADNLNRSDFCYKASKKLLENVAEAEYIRRYTPHVKREYIRDIIKNVKQQLKLALQKNIWMDEITKHNAINRLENITDFVGGTDIVYNATKFERTFGYNHLKFTSDKLVNMKREAALNTIDQYYKQLVRKSDAVFLDDIPRLDVKACYDKYLKKLILPTALLQGQIFNEKRPQYVNYGTLGSIIGHELTHGLTEYSINSNLTEEGAWWTNKTRRNFKNVTQCLIDEYGMYPEKLSGFNKNGSEVEQNLADFSGVNFAYQAYQDWVEENSDEESLPGIKYTPNQIFWIMASSRLCFDPKLAKKHEAMRMYSTYSVPSFRVIGSLRNSPYFARDFNCPVGSKMHPESKCQIFT